MNFTETREAEKLLCERDAEIERLRKIIEALDRESAYDRGYDAGYEEGSRLSGEG